MQGLHRQLVTKVDEVWGRHGKREQSSLRGLKNVEIDGEKWSGAGRPFRMVGAVKAKQQRPKSENTRGTYARRLFEVFYGLAVKTGSIALQKFYFFIFSFRFADKS